MSHTHRFTIALTILLVLSGCTTVTPPGTGTPVATPTEEPVTGHFFFNNPEDHAVNVSLYLIRNDAHPNQDMFPLKVTLLNGTTRIVTETSPVPGRILVNTTRIEPANGTLVAVTRRLPPQTTLQLVVKNIPPHAKYLQIQAHIGESGVKHRSWQQSDDVCPEPQADRTPSTTSHPSGVVCSQTSTVSYANTIIRDVVTVDNTTTAS